MGKTVEIFDSTLREGAQTPFVYFALNEKKVLLKMLYRAGVDFAEVGYSISSPQELQEIQQLARLKSRPLLSSLGRALSDDIQASFHSGVEVIDIDLGISSYQLEYLGLTLEKAFEKAFEATQMAKRTGKRVKFAAVDATRTNIKDLIKLYGIVTKAGGEWFTLCDTVGASNPDEVTFIVKSLKDANGCKVSVHFHNDFDMATANTVAAALSGADQLELTINGLGDRAGIAPFAPVVVYLKEEKGLDLRIDLTQLRTLSEYVSKITRLSITPLEPIVGNYCFKHAPGIHVAGILKDPATFEPFEPEKVGQTRSVALGRYTGRKAIKQILERRQAVVTEAELSQLVGLVKRKAAEGIKIEEHDLENLLATVKSHQT